MVSKHSLGGPFELVDCDTQRLVTDKDVFRGKWTLLYFGFTKCAEICPSTLTFMQRCLEDIDRRQKERDAAAHPDDHHQSAARLPVVRGCFVTVDPIRDNAAAVKKFIEKYRGPGSEVVGLTGNRKQLESVAKAWRVYFSTPEETEEEKAAREAKGIPEEEALAMDDNYQMDHSAAIYFIAPDGRLRDFFFKEMGQATLVEKVLLHTANAFGIDDE